MLSLGTLCLSRLRLSRIVESFLILFETSEMVANSCRPWVWMCHICNQTMVTNEEMDQHLAIHYEKDSGFGSDVSSLYWDYTTDSDQDNAESDSD